MRIYNRLDNRITKRRDISPKYLLLTFTIICVVLIFVSYFASNKVVAIREVTSKIVTPIQKGVDKIGLWTDSKVKNMQDIEELNAENDKLEEELLATREKLTRYQSEMQELEELRHLYELDDEYPDLNKTAAHVFAKDSTSWFSSFYIDKGTDDGIFVGANVMNGEGLAGVVVETYDSYSKVRAIIDDQSKVSGKIMPSNALCTVNGSINTYNEGYIEAINIDKDAAIAVGDKVITSHISDRFHSGIVIGYVSEIKLDTNNLTMTAKISPAATFENIAVVLVVTDKKQSIVEE